MTYNELISLLPTDFRHVDRYHIKTQFKKSAYTYLCIFLFLFLLVFLAKDAMHANKSFEADDILSFIAFFILVLYILFVTVVRYYDLRDKLNTTASLAIPCLSANRFQILVENNSKLWWLRSAGMFMLTLLTFLVFIINYLYPNALNYSPRGVFINNVGLLVTFVASIGMILLHQSNTVVITSEKVFLSIKYYRFSPLKNKSVEYFFDDIVSCEMETQPLMPGSLSPSLINKLVIRYRNDQGEVCKSNLKLTLYNFKTDPCWIEFVINKLVGCEDREGFLENLSHLPQGLRVP